MFLTFVDLAFAPYMSFPVNAHGKAPRNPYEKRIWWRERRLLTATETRPVDEYLSHQFAIDSNVSISYPKYRPARAYTWEIDTARESVSVRLDTENAAIVCTW